MSLLPLSPLGVNSTNSGFLAAVEEEEEDEDDDLAAGASSLSEAFVVDVEDVDDFAGASPSEVLVVEVVEVDLTGASPSDVVVVVDLTGACIKIRYRGKYGQIHAS